ncbi:hypothetical protein B0H63DRAFT_507457 [Podospora didyma]|uniref:Uncharacterized protein n=1 Tax=Podospora didyma TaxID=330526 RepID=A0AAE0NYE6_9PEZI|nr:hypothetical protein B0H63DRAFT_507457 [Podospora didyma]
MGGLPSVPIITALTLSLILCELGHGHGFFNPADVGILAKAVPNVTKMDLTVTHPVTEMSDELRPFRKSLADSLLTITANLHMLATLHLDIAKLRWVEHDNIPPGLSEYDALSIAIHRVSQLPSLQELELTGDNMILGPDIFGDVSDSGDDQLANETPIIAGTWATTVNRWIKFPSSAA